MRPREQNPSARRTPHEKLDHLRAQAALDRIVDGDPAPAPCRTFTPEERAELERAMTSKRSGDDRRGR